MKDLWSCLVDQDKREVKSSLICLHPDGYSAESLTMKPVPTVTLKDSEINFPWSN